MDRAALFAALDQTWPAAQQTIDGPFLFRKSAGGGKRVTATSMSGTVAANDIARAESVMDRGHQPRLFTLDPDSSNDPLLADLGYEALDETRLYNCKLDILTQHRVPPVTAFDCWSPLQMTKDIWAAGGIGAERLAVMDRVKGPKTSFLGRVNGRAGGAAFVALHKQCAMIHALEILPEQRRSGLATSLMIAAAHWSVANGATDFALAVTANNTPANALYTSLGMRAVARYHYRIKR